MNKCSKKLQFLSWILIYLFCVLSVGCVNVSENQQPRSGFTEHYTNTAQEYLNLAASAQAPEKQAYQLKAAGRLIQEQQLNEAERLLTSINNDSLTTELLNEKVLLTVNLQLAEHQSQQALIELNAIQQPNNLTQVQRIAYYQSISQANRQMGDYLLSAEAAIAMEPLLTHDYRKQYNEQQIWSDLNQLSTEALASQIRHAADDGQSQGWLEAAYINKQYSTDPNLLKQALAQWQQHYPQHPAQALLPSAYHYTNLDNRLTETSQNLPARYQRTSEPLRVALLLPNSGALAQSGDAIRNGFMAAYYESNKQYAPQSVQVYNTAQNNVTLLYKQAVANGSNLIIGPLTKEDVVAIKQMGNLAVPTIALNYTATTNHPNKNLYEYALSPQDEARQAAQKARRDGYSHAVIIAPAGDWGEGIADQYIRNWEATGATIIEKLLYTNKTNLDDSIKNLLRVDKSDSRKQALNKILGEHVSTTPQRRTDIDVIFLAASPSTARQIIPLLRFYYAGDIPVYSTSMIYSGKPNPLQDKDLNGVLFCEMPWLVEDSSTIAKEHKQMQTLLPNAQAQTIRLYAFGMDAYQLAVKLYHTGSIANTSIDGVTGQLYLAEPQQRIYRRLKWAQFRNGVPKQIS